MAQRRRFLEELEEKERQLTASTTDVNFDASRQRLRAALARFLHG